MYMLEVQQDRTKGEYRCARRKKFNYLFAYLYIFIDIYIRFQNKILFNSYILILVFIIQSDFFLVSLLPLFLYLSIYLSFQKVYLFHHMRFFFSRKEKKESETNSKSHLWTVNSLDERVYYFFDVCVHTHVYI